MSDEAALAVLRRLRAVAWDDWDARYDHANSRALLMREYLRRAALWAYVCGAEREWPFFDIAGHIGYDVQLSSSLEAELDEFLSSGIRNETVRKACWCAVRWAAGPVGSRTVGLDLPDPFEPLLLLFERGGGFYLEEFVELDGSAIRLGNLESNRAVPAFLTLSPLTLDALDAEGRITYYGRFEEDGVKGRLQRVFRRRSKGAQVHDEEFTAALRWEPTEFLVLLSEDEMKRLAIFDRDAAVFIEKAAGGIGAA